jgi:hypothetical protein
VIEFEWYRAAPGEVIDLDEEMPQFVEEVPRWWAPESPNGSGWPPTSPSYEPASPTGDSETRLE